MSYSYATAKATLSEGEKDRILAIYLSTDEPNVDWDKATQAFGAASVESMKISTRNLLKKIANAGGKSSVTAPHTPADGSAPPQAPKTPKGKGGRPRKRKADTTGSDDNDETPKSLRKRAAKNTPRAADDDDDDDDAEAIAKTPKKARKTPAKFTKKSVAIVKDNDEDGDEDEDMVDNINVASNKAEPAQEKGATPKLAKEDDEAEAEYEA